MRLQVAPAALQLFILLAADRIHPLKSSETAAYSKKNKGEGASSSYFSGRFGHLYSAEDFLLEEEKLNSPVYTSDDQVTRNSFRYTVSPGRRRQQLTSISKSSPNKSEDLHLEEEKPKSSSLANHIARKPFRYTVAPPISRLQLTSRPFHSPVKSEALRGDGGEEMATSQSGKETTTETGIKSRQYRPRKGRLPYTYTRRVPYTRTQTTVGIPIKENLESTSSEATENLNRHREYRYPMKYRKGVKTKNTAKPFNPTVPKIYSDNNSDENISLITITTENDIKAITETMVPNISNEQINTETSIKTEIKQSKGNHKIPFRPNIPHEYTETTEMTTSPTSEITTGHLYTTTISPETTVITNTETEIKTHKTKHGKGHYMTPFVPTIPHEYTQPSTSIYTTEPYIPETSPTTQITTETEIKTHKTKHGKGHYMTPFVPTIPQEYTQPTTLIYTTEPNFPETSPTTHISTETGIKSHIKDTKGKGNGQRPFIPIIPPEYTKSIYATEIITENTMKSTTDITEVDEYTTKMTPDNGYQSTEPIYIPPETQGPFTEPTTISVPYETEMPQTTDDDEQYTIPVDMTQETEKPTTVYFPPENKVTTTETYPAQETEEITEFTTQETMHPTTEIIIDTEQVTLPVEIPEQMTHVPSVVEKSTTEYESMTNSDQNTMPPEIVHPTFEPITEDGQYTVPVDITQETQTPLTEKTTILLPTKTAPPVETDYTTMTEPDHQQTTIPVFIPSEVQTSIYEQTTVYETEEPTTMITNEDSQATVPVYIPPKTTLKPTIPTTISIPQQTEVPINLTPDGFHQSTIPLFPSEDYDQHHLSIDYNGEDEAGEQTIMDPNDSQQTVIEPDETYSSEGKSTFQIDWRSRNNLHYLPTNKFTVAHSGISSTTETFLSPIQPYQPIEFVPPEQYSEWPGISTSNKTDDLKYVKVPDTIQTDLKGHPAHFDGRPTIKGRGGGHNALLRPWFYMTRSFHP